MKDNTTFSFNKDTGKAVYTIAYKNISATGTAQCAPEDKDIQNERIGLQLAEMRAQRKYYARVREEELKPGLRALKQLYYSMKHSAQFDPKSYEAKRLFRQIRFYEEDLNFIKTEILILKKEESYLLSRIERMKKDRS